MPDTPFLTDLPEGRLTTAIVGGGPGCVAMLDMIESDKLDRFQMRIVGVADVDSVAPGMIRAREIDIPVVTNDYRELFEIENLELIIELTGSHELRDEIDRARPRHVHLLDHLGAHLIWHLHLAEEEVTNHQRSRRHRAEEALTDTLDYLQNILDHAPVMVVTADLDGLLVSFNRTAQKAFGYSADEVLGKPASVLYQKPEEREPLVRRVLRGEVVQDYEVTMRRKDGAELPVLLHMSPMTHADGEVFGTVAMSRNIMARRALFNKICQSERLAAVGLLAAGVAHEINNPLAVISEMAGFLEDLVTGIAPSDPEALETHLRRLLPKIGEQVKRCRSITSRLLSFSRKDEVALDETEPNRALDEILSLLEKRARLDNITIHREYGTNLPMVRINEVQFEEVIVNLVNNAVQAMKPRRTGDIWISSSVKDSLLILTVRDNGPGIAGEIADRLFDPFVTTKPVGQGTGLGLSICFGIVKRYDGEIRVESEPGKGAKFDVVLHTLADDSECPHCA